MHCRISGLGNSSFFKPLFIVGMGLLFLSQSCGAIEKESRHDESRSSVNGTNEEIEKGEYVPIPEVVVPASLLEKTDHKPAEAEMDKIIQYLAYMLDEEFRPEIIEALKTEEIDLEGCGDLQRFLLERAWAAATDSSLETSLQRYLGALRKKNIGLQEIVRKFQGHMEAQGQKITQQQKENSDLKKQNSHLISNLLEKEEINKQLLSDLARQKEESGSLRFRSRHSERKEESETLFCRFDQEGEEEKSTNWLSCFFRN